MKEEKTQTIQSNSTPKAGERSKEALYAFLLSGFSALLYVLYNKIRFAGEHTLISGDLRDQYIPALREFVRSLWAGKGLQYSWDLFLGMNATAFHATYVGGSVVNLLAILFPFADMDTLILIMFIIKTSLAGMTFFMFCRKVWKTSGKEAAIFGVFYAMCGFQITTCFLNPVWLDALYILPLLLSFIVGFLEGEKAWKLILLYAYLFLCNFYMGYIVGFFSAFFFVGCFFWLHWKQKKDSIQERSVKGISVFARYAGSVILAAALGAFALVPLAVFIMTKNPEDATAAGRELVQWDPLLLLQRFFFGMTWSAAERMPYWYCGTPVFMLCPLFFLDRRNEKGEKIFFGALLILLFLSSMILPLYMFWHGFDAPDGWFHRYSFLVTFLCSALACREAHQIKDWNRKNIMIAALIEMIVVLGLGLYANWRIGTPTHKNIFLNVAIVFGWTALYLLKDSFKQEVVGKLVIGCLIFAAVLEPAANGVCQLPSFYSDTQRQIWKKESEAVAQLLAKDTGFYRVNLENETTYNHDTYWGYKGVTDFCSYENYEVRKALENMGAFTSPRLLTSFGTNPFTQMLLGMKYNIHLSGAMEESGMGASVLPYEKTLGLGFMVKDDVLNVQQNGENAFENDNQLASAMLGEEIRVFSVVPMENVEEVSQGISKGQREDYTYLQAESFNENDMAAYYFQVTGEEDKNAYIAFSGYNTPYIFFQPMIYEYEKPLDNGVFGVRYTKKMTPIEGKNTCAILMQKNYTGEYVQYKEAQIYQADQAALDRFYDRLSENQLVIEDYGNDYVMGKVNVSAADRILFTTIPYDSGWRLEKGKGEIVPLLNGAFVGIRFQEMGEQEIKLIYEAPGRRIGGWISLTAGIIFAGYIFLICKRRRENAFET